MSIAREIFGRVWNGLGRKIRGSEDLWGQVITNAKKLRRFGFYIGSVWCTGQLFQYHFINWGSSEGMSMYPTMAEHTPFTLLSRRHHHGKNMSPGDIVEFASPIFRDQLLGKRLIGMPGDFVVLDPHLATSVGGADVPGITDRRSKKEISDGVELREREEPMMIEVPQGHVYAVGDNLSWSRDSRFFGAVPMALVQGKQILHSRSGFGKGIHWTGGEQLRRIPKEEEDDYLRAYGRKQVGEQSVTSRSISTTTTEKID